MIRFVSRLIGLILLALAFIFLIYDGTQSIAANALRIAPLQDQWNNINASSLSALRASIEHHAAWLQPAIAPILDAPTWLVLGILGAILILLGRPKKPLIGYARD
jgi:hypothetical protein